jgi:hypothetical protein
MQLEFSMVKRGIIHERFALPDIINVIFTFFLEFKNTEPGLVIGLILSRGFEAFDFGNFYL